MRPSAAGAALPDADSVSDRFISPVSNVAPLDYCITTESQLDIPTTAADTSQSRTRRLETDKRTLEFIRNKTQSYMSSPALTLDTISTSSYEPDRLFFLDRSPTNSPGFADISGPASAVRSEPSVESSISDSIANVETVHTFGNLPPGMEDTGAIIVGAMDPQLVMPSPEVARRRPFTPIGKSLGKLRILVAGQTGTGKSSLIQAIVKSCEHIIHCDDPSPVSSSNVVEMFASTRPNISWRTTYDSTSSYTPANRRGSMNDVLDRNICLADISSLKGNNQPVGDLPLTSPPFKANDPQHTQSAIQYVRMQLSSLLERPLEDADLKAIIHAGAENVVDLVFYLLQPGQPPQIHLDCMRQLEQWTNVIPLLARSDELSSLTIDEYKIMIRQALDKEGVEAFRFPDHSETPSGTGVYAVSTIPRQDRDNMDASMLMDSNYFPPLVETELSKLVCEVFSADGSSWLRSCAATKIQKWRQEVAGCPQSMMMTRHAGTTCAFYPVPSTTDRQFWDRIEVSNWAVGLRRSLDLEHAFSVPLVGSDQTCVFQASLQLTRKSSARLKAPNIRQKPHQDPLGLLGLIEQVHCGGKVTLELLSSAGLVGYVATIVFNPDLACHDGIKRLCLLR